MLNERLAANRWFTSTTQQLLAETCQDRPEKAAIVFQGEGDEPTAYPQARMALFIRVLAI